MLEGNGVYLGRGRERKSKGKIAMFAFFPAYLLFSLVVQGWKKEVGERKAICLAGLGIGGARDTRRVESLLVGGGEREIGPIEAGGVSVVASHRAALALALVLWASLPCIWAGRIRWM